MFYCDPCGHEVGWPETPFKSRGPCERCGHVTVCNDMPSKYLPEPTPQRPVRPDWKPKISKMGAHEESDTDRAVSEALASIAEAAKEQT